MAIKLIPNEDMPHEGWQGFTIIADEPITIEVEAITTLQAFVYEGTEVDENSEPVGAYDSSVDNKPWAKP